MHLIPNLRQAILLACLSVIALRATAQSLHSQPFSIGETLTFESKVLGEERTLNIYLPASYRANPTIRYPVIYLLDGSVDEDFIHISGLVQFGSFPWINMIPESIVVGIANVDRKRDFTYPSSVEIDWKEFPTSGGSELFMNFLEKELPQMISERYRVTDETTLIGQSLGGLLATEILFKRPENYDSYIIVSPSLWWDDERLFTYPLPSGLEGKSVYIGVGKEGAVMERVAKNLYEKLADEGPDDLKLFFRFFEHRDHGDALHQAVYDAFEKLFSDPD